MEVFVRPNNPAYLTFEQKIENRRLTVAENKAYTDDLKVNGHGGAAILFEDGTIELMTFDPAGIKSATGNNGDFDGNNPDIRFSRTLSAPQLTGQVRDKLNETFNHPGKLSWWHKTVGSQYNLAERNPAFKKVFSRNGGDMTGKKLQQMMDDQDELDKFLNDPAKLETDPKRIAEKQAWWDWDQAMFKVRGQMKKGLLDESSASLMMEQVNQDYSSTVQKITLPYST